MIKKFFKKISMKKGTFLRYLLLNFVLSLAGTGLFIVCIFFGRVIFDMFPIFVAISILFFSFTMVLAVGCYAIEAINEKLKEIF